MTSQTEAHQERSGSSAIGPIEKDRIVSAAPQEHSRFYFDDGNLVFLVGDRLYRLHSYLFAAHSPSFLEKYCSNTQESTELDVERPSFDIFLQILYHSPFEQWNIKSIEKWMSVFHLASSWNFPTIRRLCISQIAPLSESSPFDLITLAETHGVEDWLVSAYATLCLRPDPISLSEVKERIHTEHYLAISALREDIHREFPQAAYDYPVCPGCRLGQTPECPVCGSGLPMAVDFPGKDREEVMKKIKISIFNSTRGRIPRNEYSRDNQEAWAWFYSPQNVPNWQLKPTKKPYYCQARDGHSSPPSPSDDGEDNQMGI